MQFNFRFSSIDFSHYCTIIDFYFKLKFKKSLNWAKIPPLHLSPSFFLWINILFTFLISHWTRFYFFFILVAFLPSFVFMKTVFLFCFNFSFFLLEKFLSRFGSFEIFFEILFCKVKMIRSRGWGLIIWIKLQ